MLCTSSWLVFIQNDEPLRITACTVQLHIAVAPRLPPRFLEHLQCGFVCMKHLSFEKVFVQLFIHGRQVILCYSQDPVRHGLSAQTNTPTIESLISARISVVIHLRKRTIKDASKGGLLSSKQG